MHSETKAPFDAVAEGYDRDFTHSPIGRMQRGRVWHFLEKALKGKGPMEILEINCGTGEDAFWFAGKGHAVTATDASPEMIRMARAKGSGQASFEVCAFEELTARYPRRKFDLILSNFAGLNCAGPEMHQRLSQGFSQLLRPEGLFISVLLGKKCFIEKMYFLAKGRFSEMNRRKQVAMAALSPSEHQQTWYYTTREFIDLYKEFTAISRKPVGLFLPLSYLAPFFEDRKYLLSFLNGCEHIFGNTPAFADYADHAYLVMQKKHKMQT